MQVPKWCSHALWLSGWAITARVFLPLVDLLGKVFAVQVGRRAYVPRRTRVSQCLRPVPASLPTAAVLSLPVGSRHVPVSVCMDGPRACSGRASLADVPDRRPHGGHIPTRYRGYAPNPSWTALAPRPPGGQIVPLGPVGPGCARLILAATGIGLAHTIAPIGTAVTMWHICNHTHASARTR